MSKPKKSTIEVQGTSIGILSGPDGDYISLTDMVRNRGLIASAGRYGGTIK